MGYSRMNNLETLRHEDKPKNKKIYKNTTQKQKEWSTRTHLKTEVNPGALENLNNLFYRKVSLLTEPRCQFLVVGQGAKHTSLYQWYMLFQR